MYLICFGSFVILVMKEIRYFIKFLEFIMYKFNLIF